MRALALALALSLSSCGLLGGAQQPPPVVTTDMLQELRDEVWLPYLLIIEPTPAQTEEAYQDSVALVGARLQLPVAAMVDTIEPHPDAVFLALLAAYERPEVEPYMDRLSRLLTVALYGRR